MKLFKNYIYIPFWKWRVKRLKRSLQKDIDKLEGR